MYSKYKQPYKAKYFRGYNNKTGNIIFPSNKNTKKFAPKR